MPISSVTAANGLLDDLKKNSKSQANELHGAGFLKSSRRLRATSETFKALGQIGCLPIFVIAEKWYCVTAKIVETFLDPVYNPTVTNAITWDLEKKRNIADILYNLLPQSYIYDFWLAYDSLDVEMLRVSLGKICIALSLGLKGDLSTLFSGSLGHVDKIVTDMKGARQIWTSLESLNLTILHSFFSMVEDFGRPVGIKEIHIFHDESREFEVTFHKLFEAFSKATGKDIIFPNGDKLVVGFESVKSFRHVPSHSSPMVQGADLLARSLCMFATAIISKKVVDKELLDLVRLTLPAVLLTAPKLGFIIGSQFFLQEISCSILNGKAKLRNL